MELINLMPMLIKNCRTRLFLAIVQQRATLGGAWTFTIAGTANDFHIIPHQKFNVLEHVTKFEHMSIIFYLL
jgi:hypothetical protein